MIVRFITRCPHVAVVVALLTLLGAGASQAQQVCSGYPAAQQIHRLGGSQAFSKEAADTVDDLQRLATQYEEDLRQVLAAQGLGDVADGLLAAIAAGNVEEREIAKGATYHWMAYRKGGETRVTGPVCMALSKTYPAFEVVVDRVQETDTAVLTTPQVFLLPKVCLNLAYAGERETSSIAKIPPPTCSVQAERVCASETLRIDAAGSSPGVQVTVTSADGRSQVVIPGGGGALSWSGPDPDPYRSELVVKVTGQNRDHTGKPQSCEQTATLAPCEAAPARCEIDAPARVWARSTFPVRITGHKDVRVEVVDGRGATQPATETMRFTRPGVYVFNGVATNEVGETATCTAEVSVDPRWTVRPYWTRISNDTSTRTQAIRDGGVEERSKLALEDGVGLGVDFERHLSRRLGIDFGILYAELNSDLVLDVGLAWGMADDDIGLFVVQVGPDFHLTPDRRVDLFVEPFIGFASLDQGSYSTLGETRRQDFGDDFLAGIRLGLDIPFGSSTPWSLSLGARYMTFSADLAAGVSEDVEPLLLTVGVAYDF